MTAITGSKQGMVFGGMSNIPEKFREALSAGINFFEVRTRAPMFYSRHISGPFGVSVHMEYNGTRQVSDVITEWKTGDRAAGRFEVYELGQEKFAALYLPDDPFWHNRLVIIDNHYAKSRAFNLLAFHTGNGVFPGELAKRELDIFEKIITVDAEEFAIFTPAGRMLPATFSTKQQAETDINEHNYKNYSIRPITVRIKSPQVQALIKRWTEATQRSRYGWTDCVEFQDIKKETMRQFDELNIQSPVAAAPAAVSEEAIINAILKLPPEKREELRAIAATKKAPATTFPLITTNPHEKPITWKQLKDQAKLLGIKNPERIKKGELLKIVNKAELDLISKSTPASAETTAPAPTAEEEVT
ncbi:MAG: hypothetical protein ABSH16_00225 [Sedimentisphaerales bacterium]